jgi:hypothetical protein
MYPSSEVRWYTTTILIYYFLLLLAAASRCRRTIFRSKNRSPLPNNLIRDKLTTTSSIDIMITNDHAQLSLHSYSYNSNYLCIPVFESDQRVADAFRIPMPPHNNGLGHHHNSPMNSGLRTVGLVLQELSAHRERVYFLYAW